MALKKGSISATADSSGYGRTTANLSGVQTIGRLRPAILRRVEADDSLVFGGHTQWTLSEGLDANSEETGKVLLSIVDKSGPFFPSGPVHDTDGTVLATSGGPVWIDQPTVVLEIFNATSGDILSLTVFYETAGDYRF